MYAFGVRVAALCLLASSAYAAIPPEKLDELANQLEPRLIEWRRDIHQHPELSNREFRTAKKVEAHLRSLGLEVKTGIAHTGVVGVLRGGKPGPVIALRADMDALPVTEMVDLPFKSTATGTYGGEKVGVMHACGHDAHVSILMAAAQALASVRAELPGTILFIFQPAEEGAPEGELGGARLMMDEGVFSVVKPQAVFGLHVYSTLNSGDVGYRSGALRAGSDRFRITVTGHQTHGARPWQGIDPIVTAAQIINSLQTVVSRRIDLTLNPAVVTVGAIHGGVRFNIIPDRVEMVGTIRTFNPDQRRQVFEEVGKIVQGVAQANDATASFEPGTDPNPVSYNDPDLTEKVLPTLRRVAGAEHVKITPLETGAEDFPWFAQEIPSFYFFVGITPRDKDAAKVPANHSPLFYIDESGLKLALRATLNIAVDYLSAAQQ